VDHNVARAFVDEEGILASMEVISRVVDSQGEMGVNVSFAKENPIALLSGYGVLIIIWDASVAQVEVLLEP